MIYFTSDTHFFHKAIIGYCNRPIAAGWASESEKVEIMNNLLIQNWNSKIKPDDEVYHLGDMAFCGINKFMPILEQLNGKKYWIRGNHDHSLAKKDAVKAGFVWVKDYYVLRVHDQCQDEEEVIHQYHQPIVLFHFPILSWDGMALGAWHLHGHCHGSLPETKMMRMDVGVDTNNLMPYSYEDIKQIMVMRSVSNVGNVDEKDHHGL